MYFSALKSGYDSLEGTVVNVGLLRYSQQFTGRWTYKLKKLTFVCKGFVHKEKWVKGKLGSRRAWRNKNQGAYDGL